MSTQRSGSAQTVLAPAQTAAASASAATTISVAVSEDYAGGNAKFEILADGVQVGPVETAIANHADGDWQTVTVSASLAQAPATVTVQFVNGAAGGSSSPAPNLYVQTLSVNGTSYAGSAATGASATAGGVAELSAAGALTFDVAPAAPPAAPAVALDFQANEWLNAGANEDYASNQPWSAASDIMVSQPASGGATGGEVIFGDTNGSPFSGYLFYVDDSGHLRLRIMAGWPGYGSSNYIDVSGLTDIADGKTHFVGVSYDGSGKAAGISLYVDGQKQATSVLSDTLSGSSVSGAPLIIGNMLNGAQSQYELAGQMTNFYLSNVVRPATYFQPGNSGLVDSQTQIAYLFNAGGGTTITDLSGHGNTGTLSSSAIWTATAPTPPADETTITASVSEDYYEGNAQFIILADGVQVGGVQTATALHSQGAFSSVTVSAALASAPTTVAVEFINDAYGGSPSLDRNLYVQSVTVDGTTYAGSAGVNTAHGGSTNGVAALYTDGSLTFATGSAPPPPPPAVALDFRANEYLNAGLNEDYGSNQAWSAASDIIVDQPASGGSTGGELIFGDTNGSPFSGYELWIDDLGHLRVRILSDWLGYGPGNYVDVASLADVADGKMHFIGASYDGSGKAAGVSLYVDGQKQATSVLSDTLSGSSVSGGPLIIGNQLSGAQSQYELAGEMTNFYLSNTDRPATYFQPGNSGLVDSHTQIAYVFNAGSGTTITDLSGHMNTGTLSSAAIWTT